MKKVLVFVLMLMILCTSVVAHPDGGTLGDVPKTAEDIVVDGVKDEIYNYGLVINIDQSLTGNPVKATAVANLLFKDGKLYVYAEIKDADVVIPDSSLQESSPWSCDSLEVFINAENSDDNTKTMQYRIDNTGWPCAYDQNGLADYGPDAAKAHFEFGEVTTGAGYNVEYAIPVSAATVGVNFQINDVSSDGSAQTWAMSKSAVTGEGAGSWVAAEYPFITIGGSEVALPVEIIEEEAGEAAEAAPAAAPAAAQAVSAAQTFDATAVAMVLIGISGLGIAVSKKRR